MKLADFGVATKLTEADVNTHSVVGTPYWMAPEVLLWFQLMIGMWLLIVKLVSLSFHVWYLRFILDALFGG